MPDCETLISGALCEKHQIELRQRRLRAEVLALIKARPNSVVRPQKDPLVVEPGDYHPWDKVPYVIEPAEVREPMLLAQPCPEDRMPSGIKSAVKLAAANGWDYLVTYAIGPPIEGGLEVHSVVFKARKGAVALASRHQKVGEKPFGFNKGFISVNNRLPIALGWRDITAVLGGLDWEKQQTDELRAATLVAMDCGLDFVEMI